MAASSRHVPAYRRSPIPAAAHRDGGRWTGRRCRAADAYQNSGPAGAILKVKIMTLPKLRNRADLMSVILLIALCWLFFWRMLTPNAVNQQSLVEGDFSGQFVAFAQYQAVRLGQGEVPLWNPYNNGGDSIP